MTGSGTTAYRAGAGLALLASLLTVWTTIVRDDGSGEGFFLIIMAAGVGGYSAQFQASGLARAMIGVAIMQLMFGVAIATAPITAAVAGESMRALVFNAVFAVMWLTAAALFRSAARRSASPPNGLGKEAAAP